MLSISPKAREMLDQFAEQAEEVSELVLRVEIIGRGPNGFQYDLQFVGSDDRKEDDIELEVERSFVFCFLHILLYLQLDSIFLVDLRLQGLCGDSLGTLWWTRVQ